MSLVPWDPFRELELVSNRLNRFFGRETAYPEYRERELMAAAAWAPAVDIKETPEEFIVKAELPEMKKEDIKVNVRENVLTIEGERKQEKEEKNERYHRVERTYGSFMRSFRLPEGIDEKKMLATYKDGVLDVHLPKAPAAKPRTVEVKVG
jgi:HSP20 family protein